MAFLYYHAFMKVMNSFVQNIELEINNFCNRHCGYCPLTFFPRAEKREMKESLYLLLLRQLQDISYTGNLSFNFYNEPLLSKNLSYYIVLATNHLPETNIILYSNGTLLDVKKFRKLLKLGVTTFIITQHEEDKGKSYPFIKTFDQLNSFEKKKVKFQQYDELQLTNRGGILNDEKVPSLTPCHIMSFMMVITIDGDVLPCFEDYHKKNIIDNIQNRHIKDIWNDPSYVKLRQDLQRGLRFRHEVCQNCNRIQVLPPS